MSDNKASDRRMKRRVVIDDNEPEDMHAPEDGEDDENSLGSNPDEFFRDDGGDEDEGEGEDLAETWLEDYAPAPELDSYDATMLADDDEVNETYEEQMRYRREAERQLDMQQARRRQREQEADENALEDEDVDEEDDSDEDDLSDEEGEEGGFAEKPINLEAFECPLREWIAEDRTRREISRRFKKFLISYYPFCDEISRFEKKNKGNGEAQLPPHLQGISRQSFYKQKIRAMCAQNSSSLEVSYRHLAESLALFAIWLTDIPKDMLIIFNDVLRDVVKGYFPRYIEIMQDMHVRVIELPICDKLRDLRQGDLNNLVKVSGVITRRTGVFPVIKATAYDCVGCGAGYGPFAEENGQASHVPSVCTTCNLRGPFKVNSQKSRYGNYQNITLQESPGTVPPGRVPRYKDVVLMGDLIDCARPGEEIEVTGIFTHKQVGFSKDKQGFPTFSTAIEANYVQKKNVASNTGLSEEDKRQIRELSQDPDIRERIIRSIAPSIYGHKHIKTAVALSLFGGRRKEGGNGSVHRVRGDINILLLGDPGTAKSQMLKYAEKIAPRSVYTTGKGASAVGLTAGVHRDMVTKEWTLEGGALVLADQGVCLIDEFDKMNEQDRTSIHEAMEQQTISVSKAGIVTSLQARCSVIAAANPIGGRYDASFSFAENVELTDPILQRFDVLCVLQDTVDAVVDERLATFVVKSHMRSHPDGYLGQGRDNNEGNGTAAGGGGVNRNSFVGGLDEEEPENGAFAMEQDDGPQPIDQKVLKKYISYARAFVKPVLHDLDSEKIASLYADLRKQSAQTGGVPIAVRHIESIVRMAEASAKMCLRDTVRPDDIDLSIKIILDSFLQSQKVSVRKVLMRGFKKYLSYGEEINQLLLYKLNELINDQHKLNSQLPNPSSQLRVPITDFQNQARALNIFDLTSFYNSTLFRSHRYQLDKDNGEIVKHEIW